MSIDFNGVSTHLGFFLCLEVRKLHSLYILIYIFVQLTCFLYTVLSNTDNF